MTMQSIRIDGDDDLVFQVDLSEADRAALKEALVGGTVIELEDPLRATSVLLRGGGIRIVEIGPPMPSTRGMHLARNRPTTPQSSTPPGTPSHDPLPDPDDMEPTRGMHRETPTGTDPIPTEVDD